MKKLFILLTVLFVFNAGAWSAGSKDAKAAAASAKQKATQKLEEKAQDKIKELAEKYASAAAKDKPALERQIRAALTAEEDKKIAFTKEQITRREAQLKALKETAKTSEQTKTARVEEMLSKIKQGDTEFLKNKDFPAIPALQKTK